MNEILFQHIMPGIRLDEAIRLALEAARQYQTSVLLCFNGEPLILEAHHTADEVLDAWSRSRHMARHQ